MAVSEQPGRVPKGRWQVGERWLREGGGSLVETREGFEVSFSFANRTPSLARVLPSEFTWGLPLYGVNFGFESVKLVKATFIRMLAIRSLWEGNREALYFLANSLIHILRNPSLLVIPLLSYFDFK